VGSDLSIKFSDYGLFLAREDVVRVLELATSSAFSHDADTIIGTVPLVSRTHDVTIIFIPPNDTTWRMRTTALRGMQRAVRDRGIFFEWSFNLAKVGLSEEGEIGYGRLSALKTRRMSNASMLVTQRTPTWERCALCAYGLECYAVPVPTPRIASLRASR